MTPNQQITPLAAGAASPVLPLAIILALGSMWGLAFSFSKMATMAGVQPVSYTFWQGIGAGTAVLLICRLRGMPVPLAPRYLRYYATIGLVALAVPNVNMVTAIAHLPAGVIVLTIPFVPLITYVIAIGMKMEHFSPLRFVGVLCGLAGVAMIVLPRASLPGADAAPWFLMALLTPACYAAGNVLAMRLRPADARSLPLAGGMLLAAGLFLAPVVFATDALYLPSLPAGPAEIAVLGQITISCVAYFIFFEGLRLAGPVFMSFTGYIVTLTGIAWGILLFGERHNAWVWGAAALIFIGLALVNLRRNGAPVSAGSGRRAGPSG